MKEADYKKLYFHAMHEMDQIIRKLISLQQECEEMYLQENDETKNETDEEEQQSEEQ